MSAVNSIGKPSKGYKGIGMDGNVATWYAKTAYKTLNQYKDWSKLVSKNISADKRVLEVAPCPGYLSIELGKLGYQVTGLDISQTFVEIAKANARAAQVEAEFRQGNASAMPFDRDTFDFIICTSAFKNFSEPVAALQEMWRVLKNRGKALVIDLRRDASLKAINGYVDSMRLNWIDTLTTKWTFKHMLIKRAYTKNEMDTFVRQTGFNKYDIRENALGFELWLEK